MKMPYDLLITDRVPFVLYERTAIGVSSSSVIAKTKDRNQTVPVSSIHCLMLGNGTSITSEAAILCARHNCYVAFLRGGINAHSIWHAGRYPDPRRLVKQVEAHSNPPQRLKIAKYLLKLRIKYLTDGLENLLSTQRIDSAESIEELLGLEGSLAKQMYSIMASKRGIHFVRNPKSLDSLNGTLSLCNNALYNFTATIAISLGLSPSIGFLHGQTRRGGLVFDIADVFKYPIFMKDLFSGNLEGDSRAVLRELSDRLSNRRKMWVKRIIESMNDCIHV